MTNTAHSVIFYTGPYYDEGSEPEGGGNRGEDGFLSANMGGGSQVNSSPRVLVVNVFLCITWRFVELRSHYFHVRTSRGGHSHIDTNSTKSTFITG